MSNLLLNGIELKAYLKAVKSAKIKGVLQFNVLDGKLTIDTGIVNTGLNSSGMIKYSDIVEYPDTGFSIEIDHLMKIINSVDVYSVLSLKEEVKHCTIRSDKDLYRIPKAKKHSLPAEKQLQGIGDITLGNFKKIATVIDGISGDETRYFLNGINIVYIDNHSIEIVATDGRRLFRNIINGSFMEFESFIIRKSFLKYIIGLKAEDEEKISIMLEPVVNKELTRKYQIKAQGLIFTNSAINGRFPNYGKILDFQREKTYTLNFESKKVLNVLKKGKKFVDARVKRIFIVIDNGNVEIKTIEEPIEFSKAIGNTDHEDIRIGLNVDFLTEAISSCGSKEFSFSYSDTGDPVFIKTNDNNYVGMIQPMWS